MAPGVHALCVRLKPLDTPESTQYSSAVRGKALLLHLAHVNRKTPSSPLGGPGLLMMARCTLWYGTQHNSLEGPYGQHTGCRDLKNMPAAIGPGVDVMS